MAGQAKIGIIMGSLSDWPTMKCAADVLEFRDFPDPEHSLTARLGERLPVPSNGFGY